MLKSQLLSLSDIYQGRQSKSYYQLINRALILYFPQYKLIRVILSLLNNEQFFNTSYKTHIEFCETPLLLIKYLFIQYLFLPLGGSLTTPFS